MSRVAALYDIHDSLPALEAVLAEVQALDVDRVVIGGDVVPGPMPCETIARLRALDRPTRFIVGNCQVAVLGQAAGAAPEVLPEPAREVIPWTARELAAEELAMLGTWPKTVRLPERRRGGRR